MAGNVVFNIEGKFQILDRDDANVRIVKRVEEVGQVQRLDRAVFVMMAPARYQELLLKRKAGSHNS